MKQLLQQLLVAAAVTGIYGVIYIAVQQVYRTGANDPQIEQASEIASRLRAGKNVAGYFADSVDIRESLSVFRILYDAGGHPVRSAGYLDGAPPALPEGVLDATRSHGEDRVTWEPQRGLRIALVTRYIAGSSAAFVVAGRSLSEEEKRQRSLGQLVLAGWLMTLIVLFIAGSHYFRTGERGQAAG